MSWQDEPNLALWLATRAGKIELSCPLGIRALSSKENLLCFGVFIPYNKSFIDQAFFGQDGWILDSFFFWVLVGFHFFLSFFFFFVFPMLYVNHLLVSKPFLESPAQESLLFCNIREQRNIHRSQNTIHKSIIILQTLGQQVYNNLIDSGQAWAKLLCAEYEFIRWLSFDAPAISSAI